MPDLGKESELQLDTCDEKIKKVFRAVVRTYDCKVIEGHRNKQKQHAAFLAGKSKLDWPNGNHNSLPSKAADVSPYPMDWGGSLIENGSLNRKHLFALLRFYHFAGFVQGAAEQLGIPLRWGGDWDSDRDLTDQIFNDLVHFELLEVHK